MVGRLLSDCNAALTLPRIECRGFFLHPGGLPLSITGPMIEVPCPEAFYRASLSASKCPRYRLEWTKALLAGYSWLRCDLGPAPRHSQDKCVYAHSEIS